MPVRKCFTVERKRPDGRYRPIEHVVCSNRKDALKERRRIAACWVASGRPEPRLRVGVFK